MHLLELETLGEFGRSLKRTVSGAGNRSQKAESGTKKFRQRRAAVPNFG